MNKTMIAPLIALLALAVQTIFHVEVNDGLQADIGNAILTIITVYGVFKNHKKGE